MPVVHRADGHARGVSGSTGAVTAKETPKCRLFKCLKRRRPTALPFFECPQILLQPLLKIPNSSLRCHFLHWTSSVDNKIVREQKSDCPRWGDRFPRTHDLQITEE